MTIPRITVDVFNKNLDKYSKQLRKGTPAVKKTMENWVIFQRRFLHKRFVKFSNGGGTWPPLKPATIKKKKKKGWGVRILRITNTLLEALKPNAPGPGSFAKIFPRKFQVIVGYGGSTKHPMSKKSIAKLAEIHHKGKGRVPARTIVVDPDSDTKKKMTKEAKTNLTKEATKMFPKVKRNPTKRKPRKK